MLPITLHYGLFCIHIQPPEMSWIPYLYEVFPLQHLMWLFFSPSTALMSTTVWSVKRKNILSLQCKLSRIVSFTWRIPHTMCVSRSSCCLYINQHFTRGCFVWQLRGRLLSDPTHAVSLAAFPCCTTAVKTLPDSAGSPSASGPLCSVCCSTPSAPPELPVSGSLTAAAPCPRSGSDTGRHIHWSGSTHLETKQGIHRVRKS